MQLEKIIIATRLRSGWAALDLGIKLAQRFWFTAVAVYLVPALIIYALTCLISEQYSWLPYLVLWWCKPLFERPILCLISRELFSEAMPFSKVMGAYKSWLLPSIVSSLTLRRLSVYRGLTAPVSMLEGPRGAAYRERVNVLGSKESSPALWLTVVLFHVETILAIGLVALLELLVPQAIDLGSLFSESSIASSNFTDLLSLLVMAAIAPFYAIAGFALYVSRRIELEGWDIEIAFRDLARQREQAEQSSDGLTRHERLQGAK